MSPEMKERVWETVSEMIDDDFIPDPYDGPYEPRCWGFNSYEHYKGECQHFALDEAATDDEYEDSDTARWKDQDWGLE